MTNKEHPSKRKCAKCGTILTNMFAGHTLKGYKGTICHSCYAELAGQLPGFASLSFEGVGFLSCSRCYPSELCKPGKRPECTRDKEPCKNVTLNTTGEGFVTFTRKEYPDEIEVKEVK